MGGEGKGGERGREMGWGKREGGERGERREGEGWERVVTLKDGILSQY